MTSRRSFWQFLFVIALGPISIPTAYGQIESPKDAFSVVLIHADLDDADKTMAVRDINKDGFLDKHELQSLPWGKTATEHDQNHDGKLTHLEVALRFALLREENDVEQIDRTVASRAMQKNDRNGNGQIDPDEITSAWPEEPNEIDVNADGILTLTELTNAFAFRRMIRTEIGIIGVDQGWAIKIRNRFDRNADGGLNPDEWTDTPMPSDPALFDADKDERLSLTEIATMLAKHRQKLGLSANDQLQARALISLFDADFNGIVTPLEWQPREATMADAVTQLKQFDGDKNDQITLFEIETILGKRRDEMGYTDRDATSAKVMIERHDENRDLRINANELKETSGGGYLGKEELPQIDRNTDGNIDQDELARHLARQK